MNDKQMIIKAEGGVCAPLGFSANGVHCGIRAGSDPDKKDLALIVSKKQAVAAAVYTTNKVKGAPITVTKEHIADGLAQAVICNSGNANTCNADGIEIAKEMSRIAAEALNGSVQTEDPIPPEDVIVGSTGVIGEPLSTGPIKASIAELVAGLSADAHKAAAEAIMTTDTIRKEAAVEFAIGGKTCRIGGMAKGSGMIHPNMATMLVFLTSDAAITADMLQQALSADIPDTFNMISVDGDTSTNDTVAIMANGMAGNPVIDAEGEDYDTFYSALHAVMSDLCQRIAADGEGATKLLTCSVTGARTKEDAKTVAKSIICSSLVKTAMAGGDANWGRVLCAIGDSEADVDVTKVELSFRSPVGEIRVCESGAGIPFSEEEAADVLAAEEVEIIVDLHDGDGEATAWGCDPTHEYISINADYRT